MELAVSPDCPVAALASEVPLAEVVAPYGDGPPQLVVERGASLPESGAERVATTEESVVCRLPARREACPHDRCPACDLRDIEVCECGTHATTVGGGGKVFARDGERWVQESTTGQNLKAVDRGSTPLAVGAGGTVIAKK